jgi:dolichyl-phosphate beta-glucosyltransferase
MPPAAEPRVSYVLPVFDEEQRVAELLRRLVPTADELGHTLELVFVDDGSEDDTVALLEAARANEPRIRVERLPENRGKGAAVRHGMLTARGALRVTMDADLSTDLEALPRLIAGLEAGYDVVLGSRNLPGAVLGSRQPFSRELLGRGFRRLAAKLFAPEVSDFTCGFKGFRAAAAEAVFERTTIDGWAYDVELVVVARLLGYRIGEVPVRWSHASGSKVDVPWAVLEALSDLVRIAARRRAGRYR